MGTNPRCIERPANVGDEIIYRTKRGDLQSGTVLNVATAHLSDEYTGDVFEGKKYWVFHQKSETCRWVVVVDSVESCGKGGIDGSRD